MVFAGGKVMLLLKIWHLEILLIFLLEHFAFIQSYLFYEELFWNVPAIFFLINQLGDKWKPEKRKGDRNCPLDVGHCLGIGRGEKTWSNKGLEKEVTWLTCNMPRQNSIIGQSGFDSNPFIFVFMIKVFYLSFRHL